MHLNTYTRQEIYNTIWIEKSMANILTILMPHMLKRGLPKWCQNDVSLLVSLYCHNCFQMQPSPSSQVMFFFPSTLNYASTLTLTFTNKNLAKSGAYSACNFLWISLWERDHKQLCLLNSSPYVELEAVWPWKCIFAPTPTRGKLTKYHVKSVLDSLYDC